MKVRVYDGPGVDPFTAAALSRALAAAGATVSTVDATTLRAGGWEDADVLAVPGGADRFYARDWADGAVGRVREWVEAGGRYLGICAGGYFACRRIVFDGADLTLHADRELAFFPGTAVGPLGLARPYRVGDVRCAAAVGVDGVTRGTVLYWGGCRFDVDAGEKADVLMRYADLPAHENVAAVRVRVGGGLAVLTGFHAEADADAFAAEAARYPQHASADVAETVRRLREGEATRRDVWHAVLRGLTP